MRLSRNSGLEEIVGIGVGTACAIFCTLLLVAGTKLFDMGSSIPAIDVSSNTSPSDIYNSDNLETASEVRERQRAQVNRSEETSYRLKPPVSFTPDLEEFAREAEASAEKSVAVLTPAETATENDPVALPIPTDFMLPRARPSPLPEYVLASLQAQSTNQDDASESSVPSANVSGEMVSAAQASTVPVVPWAVIHYSDESLADSAKILRQQLIGEGISDVSIRKVRSPVNFNQIRYYHESEADLATRLEQAISSTDTGSFKRSDFTGFRPQPKAGLIEVWLGSPGV